MHADEFLPFIIPITMYLFGGDHSFISALKMFMIILAGAGFIWSMIGTNAGHYHPDIVCAGDPVR